MSRLKKFIFNSFLMTGTAFFMRLVALAFGVWISNKIGAEAMGLYSLISSVYTFAFTLATAGISLTVTRMTADALGRGKNAEIRGIMARCILYALFFGILSQMLLSAFADIIGNDILSDARTVAPLRLMSFTLPLISVASALSGYFTAMRRVVKNSATQITEQGIKITVTVILLTTVMPSGIEYACIALALGGVVAETLSAILMILLYIADKRKYVENGSFESEGMTKKMMLIALPVAFSTLIRSALVTVEHILIPSGLRKSGSSRERSLAAYGTLTGMAFPVIMFPMALISAFAGMTVPELSECLAKGHKNRIKYISGRVWQFSLLFAIGISGIFICFSEELGAVLYNSAEAGLYIRLLSPLLPIMYLDHTTDALLKGLGEQFYSMNVNLIDAALSCVLVLILVPKFGINGYVAIIIIMECLNFGLSAVRLIKISSLRPRLVKWLVRPLLCVVAATLASYFLFSFIEIPIAWLSLAVHLAVSIGLYIIILSVTQTVDAEDKKWIKSIFKSKES